MRAYVLTVGFLAVFLLTGSMTMSAPTVKQQLWVYPAPGQEGYRSEHYRVRVEQGVQSKPAFCYQARSMWHHEFPDPYTAQFFPKENNWVSFSFSGKVTVVIEPINIKTIGVELRPDPQGVKASLKDGKIRVDITRPGQYYVLVKAQGDETFDFEHPLFIFANPPETGVPLKGTPGVHYFGPGVHNIGFQYKIKAGETVYLAGGAMVQGSIYYDGAGVKILGRGILTDRKLMIQRVKSALAEKAAGKEFAWALNHDQMFADKWATIIGDDHGHGALIEGITIIESPFYMIRTHGTGMVFRNLKLMSDLYNNNGIVSGSNHKIVDCFFKVEDDVFCWVMPVSETRNCVIWKQDNGCVVQLGWGHNYATHGHIFKDNWVIMDRTTVQNWARGLFGMASSSGTSFTDCRIENLKVWGDVLNFLAIDNRYIPTPWSQQMEGKAVLRPVNLYFKNVQITGTERGFYWGSAFADLKDTPMRSRLRTENEGTIKITLDNVSINGKRLRSDADWPNGLLRTGKVTVDYR